MKAVTILFAILATNVFAVPLTVREDVVQIPEKVPCTARSAVFCLSDWKLGWCPHRDIDRRIKDLPKSEYTKLKPTGDYRCNDDGKIFDKDDPAKEIRWSCWGDDVVFFERELFHEPEAGSMRCLNGDTILNRKSLVIVSGSYPTPH
jgi:hypothetical protein